MPTSPKNLKLTNTKCTVRATTTALFSFLNHTSLKSEVIRFNYIRQVSSELCFPVESIQRYKAKKNVPGRFSIKCFPVSSHWSICGGGWWSTETANAVIKSFPIGCHNNTWGVMIYQRRRLHLQSSQFVNCFYQGLHPLHLQHTTNSCYNKCLVKKQEDSTIEHNAQNLQSQCVESIYT